MVRSTASMGDVGFRNLDFISENQNGDVKEDRGGIGIKRQEKKRKIKALLCLKRKCLKTDSGTNMEDVKDSENRGF